MLSTIVVRNYFLHASTCPYFLPFNVQELSAFQRAFSFEEEPKHEKQGHLDTPLHLGFVIKPSMHKDQ